MPQAVGGQSAERIDEVLAFEELDAAVGAYVAAAAAGVVAPDASPQQALAALEERGLAAGRYEAGEPVRLDEFSRMVMVSFDVSGGLMYALAPGPRYAFRELQHEGVFVRGGNPGDAVSGRLAMRIAGRVESIVEARR